MQRRVSVRAIVIQDSHLFAVKLKNYSGAIMLPQEYWCVPGGTVEPGEPLVSALEREVLEELGVQPAIGDLLYTQQFAYNNKEHLELFFHVTNTSDFLDIDLSKSTHGEEEIATYGFIDAAIENVLPKFLSLEDLSKIKSSDNSVKLFNYLEDVAG